MGVYRNQNQATVGVLVVRKNKKSVAEQPQAETKTKQQVFVSYSHEDGQEFAKALADWLETNEFAAWMDHEIVPGQDYDSTIEAAIRESDFFVVVVSNDTERPDSFVRREIQYANDIKKPIVPVRLSRKAQGPILLKRRQWLSSKEALGVKMINCLNRISKGTVDARGSQKKKDDIPLPLIGAFGLVCLAMVWTQLPPSIEQDARENPKNVNQQSKPEKGATDQAVLAGLKKHAELMELRGKVISEYLAKYHDDDVRSKFVTLHEKNLKALNEANFTLSHELTMQIRDVLEPFRYRLRSNYYPGSEKIRAWEPKFNEPLKEVYLEFQRDAFEDD